MRWKEYEISAMERALALAARGRGAVEPNPMVGAVVVRNGRVVAEGYHRLFGGPHAEIYALRKAGRGARGAELFVTLEPCCHFGKTPPCTEAIVAAGIRRVVVATKDPFYSVRGRGIRELRGAGIRVDVGLLGKEARRLNAPFIKLRTTGLPYVIAKYAMTADGRIATAAGDSHWISCEQSRRMVHDLRRRVDAVVVGIGTAVADDPLLTARPQGRRVAARVVLDSGARLPLGSNLVRSAGDVPLIVAVTKAAPRKRIVALEAAGAEVLVLPGRKGVDVRALARELGRRDMTNILVEGGGEVLGSCFAARLVDELVAFVAPKLSGEGTSPTHGWGVGRMRNALRIEDVTYERSGCDVAMRGRVAYGKRR